MGTVIEQLFYIYILSLQFWDLFRANSYLSFCGFAVRLPEKQSLMGWLDLEITLPGVYKLSDVSQYSF